MLDNIIRNLQDTVIQLNYIETSKDFDSILSGLKDFLKTQRIDSKYIMELEQQAYYPVNQYSDKENQTNLFDARKRVIEYLESLINNTSKDDLLLTILNNYYLFLESLLEHVPHKSSSIQKEHLSELKIRNEHDIHHLLYAYLKPIYPMARTEVNEDTGYSTVRTDIFLDPTHVIEVKYTRKNMGLKKLTEELEADMVHYSAECIYFFIYDQEKIIKNPQIFKTTYENKIIGKQIHIIIHQPKLL